MSSQKDQKKIIETRAHIELLVDSFYTLIRDDEVLGPIFNRVMDDWDEHLPKMYRFWESMLLDKMTYSGNPMTVHIAVDKQIRLSPEHFDRWLTLWRSNINAKFKGPLADMATEKATRMAKLMAYKVRESRHQGFIQ